MMQFRNFCQFSLSVCVCEPLLFSISNTFHYVHNSSSFYLHDRFVCHSFWLVPYFFVQFLFHHLLMKFFDLCINTERMHLLNPVSQGLILYLIAPGFLNCSVVCTGSLMYCLPWLHFCNIAIDWSFIPFLLPMKSEAWLGFNSWIYVCNFLSIRLRYRNVICKWEMPYSPLLFGP